MRGRPESLSPLSRSLYWDCGLHHQVWNMGSQTPGDGRPVATCALVVEVISIKKHLLIGISIPCAAYEESPILAQVRNERICLGHNIPWHHGQVFRRKWVSHQHHTKPRCQQIVNQLFEGLTELRHRHGRAVTVNLSCRLFHPRSGWNSTERIDEIAILPDFWNRRILRRNQMARRIRSAIMSGGRSSTRWRHARDERTLLMTRICSCLPHRSTSSAILGLTVRTINPCSRLFTRSTMSKYSKQSRQSVVEIGFFVVKGIAHHSKEAHSAFRAPKAST